MNKSKPTVGLFALSLCIAALAHFLNRGGLLDRALEYGGSIPFCVMLFVEICIIGCSLMFLKIWFAEIRTEPCLALVGIGIVMLAAPPHPWSTPGG